MVIHSSFEDFILFLYVHISRADSNYDPKEMDVIQEKMKGLYPTKTDFDKKLYATLREYKNFEKSKLPELFDNTLKHFKADKNKEKILADLSDIIHADGKVQDSETNALNALKHTINQNL
jgi:uncharacterized tellurite resistance protein B-like protein